MTDDEVRVDGAKARQRLYSQTPDRDVIISLVPALLFTHTFHHYQISSHRSVRVLIPGYPELADSSPGLMDDAVTTFTLVPRRTSPSITETVVWL